MRLHLNKPGIRALGVAESFRPSASHSVLAGVVMRSDFLIDGVAISRTKVGGDDATASVGSLFRSLRRNDINLLIISGAILSLYNIIDVDGLSRRLKLPVVCVTFKGTRGIEASIRRHFPGRSEPKLEAYRRLGPRTGIRLRTGHRVYVRTAGADAADTKAVLDMFTLQGSIPEPLRVAKLIARSALSKGV